MKYRNVTPARIGRQTHLARALALALALGGGFATAAVVNPDGMGQVQSTSAAWQQAQQAQAARQTQRTADAERASAQPMGTTIYVANCNDTGGGSLRDAVATAASGDTIDMTAMSCNVINLVQTLTVPQDDLTLVGKHKFGSYGILQYPDTFIHGTHRAIQHYGTGTLTLTSVDLSDGHIDIGTIPIFGACIYSSANVTIDRSYVHNCSQQVTAGSSADAKGGAIYAQNEVTLDGSLFASSRVYDNVTSAVDGDAYGGGIYAGGWVRLNEWSSVYGNLAESASGNARGGGIYGESYVDLTESSSSVRDNRAETHATLTLIKGAGIYAESDSVIYGSVMGNESNSGVTANVYIGGGAGIYAENGISGFGANFSDNHGNVSSGGGIYTTGYLYLTGSTVADNSGYGTGAIFAQGDVSIHNSTITGNRSRNSANIKLGPTATSDIVIGSSTISNNTITGASTNGAALNLQHDATIQNSTITGNVEKNATDTKYGAGIALDSNVNVNLRSTIVGGNFIEKTGGGVGTSDVNEAKGASGASVIGVYNLITWSGVSPMPSDTISGYLPILGPLSDNGGPTKTHEPCRSSRVINNGVATSGVPTDQRGDGFPRLMGSNVEIGAIEAPDYSDILFRNGFEEGACGS